MNFDMFSNNQLDDMDPNYIYPRPYLDPMAFFNPYSMYPGQMNQNMNMANYMTYMNPYMANPLLGQEPATNNLSNYPYEDDDIDDFDDYDDFDDINDNYNMKGIPNNTNPGMNGMPGIPPGMMPGMMMPGMFPGMMPGMFPGMMMPGMPPGMNMYPFMQMMPGMEAINIEEFDEEEM